MFSGAPYEVGLEAVERFGLLVPRVDDEPARVK